MAAGSECMRAVITAPFRERPRRGRTG
jgi:hypothetical protein